MRRPRYQTKTGQIKYQITVSVPMWLYDRAKNRMAKLGITEERPGPFVRAVLLWYLRKLSRTLPQKRHCPELRVPIFRPQWTGRKIITVTLDSHTVNECESVSLASQHKDSQERPTVPQVAIAALAEYAGQNV